MNIYEILESHTIIEWFSRTNVKDEYVKPRVINPEGEWQVDQEYSKRRTSDSTYKVRTKPVQDVPVRTTVSQYHLFLEDGPPDSTMLYVRDLCYTMSN